MRRTALFAAILLGIAAGVFFLFRALEPAVQVGQLPDGSTLRVLGTAVGTAPFTTEKSWHRLAKRFLPIRLQGWIPQSFSGSCSGSSNTVTLFFQHLNPNPANSGSAPWDQVAAVDEDGFRHASEGGYCGFGSGPGKALAIIMRSLPRRQREFDLQIFGPKDELLTTLRVANPMRGPFPEWTPEPLPITRTNGPVTITLESLTEKGSERSRWVSPKWRIKSADPRWERARPKYHSFLDATGNEGAFLSPKEPAWKLQTTVHRERREDFDPDERLIVTNVAVPGPGEFQALDLAVERLGVGFLIHGLAGAGSLVISNGVTRTMRPPRADGDSGHSSGSSGMNQWEQWGSDTPFFLIEVSNVQPHDDLRFRLTAEDGREIPLKSSGYHGKSGQPGGRVYNQKFTPPDDVRAVSLEIIVSRGRPFEFTIDPAEIRRSSQPKP